MRGYSAIAPPPMSMFSLNFILNSSLSSYEHFYFNRFFEVFQEGIPIFPPHLTLSRSFNDTVYSLFTNHHSIIFSDTVFSSFTFHVSLKQAAFDINTKIASLPLTTYFLYNPKKTLDIKFCLV